MTFPIRRVALAADTGNLDAITAGGGTVGGTAVRTGQFAQGTLNALVDVTIATGSLTIAPKWQVSDDNSTFYDLREGSGPAPVTITATGTRVLACPEAARAWKFVRPAIDVAGADATASDTYSITSRYVRRQAFDAS